MEKERKDVTGLNVATDKQTAEYNIVEGLLKAAEFKNEEKKVVEIRRNGQFLFAVNVRAVSESEAREARKKATTYTKNPAGKGYPKIESDYNSSLFNSWLIYIATSDHDKKEIWGNRAVMDKLDVMSPVDTIDAVLTIGEKLELVKVIEEISGLSNDDDDDENENEIVPPEVYAKN